MCGYGSEGKYRSLDSRCISYMRKLVMTMGGMSLQALQTRGPRRSSHELAFRSLLAILQRYHQPQSDENVRHVIRALDHIWSSGGPSERRRILLFE